MPGVNPLTAATDAASTLADDLTNIFTHPPTPAEPPLACYVTASCSAGATQPATAKARKCKRKRGHRATDSKRHRCKKHKEHRSR
jgi:hypothetical protein